MATQRLFAYGTLVPGRDNAAVMAGIAGEWQPATVVGRLYASGWGAALGYPGLVLGPDGETIEGFVFVSDELDAHWTRLDAFEGPGYQRVSTRVRLGDGSFVEACVYCLSSDPAAGD